MKNLNQIDSFLQLKQEAEAIGVSLKSGNRSTLSQPLTIENTVLPNRLVVQPVEGADAEPDGSPGEMTKRRYLGYARGGSGLIWMEATAILPSLKSNPNQLVLTKENKSAFQRLIDTMKEEAVQNKLPVPAVVLQMTHPGRSCFPVSVPATDRPVMDRIKPSGKSRALSDDDIKRLADVYGSVTALARDVGFDGVEVKACHHYFISELLSAFERPGSYGGSFENRVRHLKEALAASRAETGKMFLTVRLNLYDGVPYPDGFGMASDGSFSFDSTEPLRLIEELKDEFGIALINCTAGSPNHKAFPDLLSENPLFSLPEDPLKAGARFHHFAKVAKAGVPGVSVVATGFTHLGPYAPFVGAAMIEAGEADLIGFGRQALAYPNYANDILRGEGMKKERCCICCGGCGNLISAHKNVGCVVFDSLYRQ